MRPYKIILISPPIFDYYRTPARMEPLGLLYIKKSLERFPDVAVEILDAARSMKKKRAKAPESFDHLKDIYVEDHSCFSLFHHYFRFGDSFNKIIAYIKEGAFDLAGISSLYSGYHPDVEALVGRIKRETSAKVAAGGWAVFAEPERLRNETAADYLITGDGETVFPKLVAALMNGGDAAGIEGLILCKSDRPAVPPGRSNNELFINSFPDREQPYFFRGKRIARMILSRGCRFSCSFCSVPRRYDFHARPLESIERELAYLHGIGVGIIDFEDDNLFHDTSFAVDLLRLLKQYHDRGMSFAAMNGITATNLVPVLDQAIEAGFIEFNLSLVTGSEPAARGMRRPVSREAIREIALRSAGRVDVLAFIIGGLPGSTPRGVIDDIVFLAGLPLTIGFSPLYLLPDVPLFEEMGLPADRRLMRGSALYAFGDGFDRSAIVALWKYIRMINRIKTMGNVPDHTDRENLHYFGKSLREKTWYVKKHDGSWQPGMPFGIDLPGALEIANGLGEKTRWDFTSEAELS